MIIDMDKLEILKNNSNFIISSLGKDTGMSFKDEKLMEHYKVLNEKSIKIELNQVSLIISNVNNPQVRTGFRVINGNLVKNTSGALINTLFGKDMKIKKLDNIKPIVRKENRIERRIKTEYYINNENEQVFKNIPIF